jgi:hypothetical protein
MPAPLFHVGAQAMCPHAGQVTTVSTNTRVLAGGQPVATMNDQFMVAGCAFTVPPGKPQPCVKIQWLVPATRVLVNGAPAILRTSVGLAQSAEQIPGGPPSVVNTQMKALGT